MTMIKLDQTKIVVHRGIIKINDVEILLDELYYSNDITQYLKEIYLELYLGKISNLLLSDFDVTKFIVDGDNHTLTINTSTIDIRNILSEQIKNYCFMKLTNLQILKYMVEDVSILPEINTFLYSMLQNNNKLLILKYCLAKHISTVLNVNFDPFLYDLLEQTIMTGRITQTRQLLEKKTIGLNKTQYQNLINVSFQMDLHDTNALLIEYRTLDEIIYNGR